MAVSKVNQRGAIVLMTVFFVIILIAFAALALDLGRLYVLRTDMQNAADAASLAGAVELDGKPEARNRAVRAASNLLSHKGQFSTSPELLKQLANYWDPADPQNSTFVFYSWINAEPDPVTYDCGNKPTEEWEGGDTGPKTKCITRNDEDARYIKVKLDPELTTAEKKDYGIDFYFIPVLSLITGSPITEGFTKVMAIAGNTDSTYCNLPPLMICAPPGGFDSVLSVGQQVLLKTQGPSATWLPGDFAFLYPVECSAGDTNCSIPDQLNKALISQLAQEREVGCSPPEVTPLPGNRQPTAYAVNTRLGLYGSLLGTDYSDNDYPAATDTIDYPKDDNLDDTSSTYDPLARYGSGNWDPVDYFATHHGGMLPPHSNMSRFQTYYWELYGAPSDWNDIYHNQWEDNEIASLSNVAGFPNATPPVDPAQNPQKCTQATKGGGPAHAHDWDADPYCENYTGDPRLMPQYTSPPGVRWEKPNRRVWFVAALNCTDYADDINNNKPFRLTFGEGGNGEFDKFFITNHVRAAKQNERTSIYAEYLGPASGEEKRHILIHNIVQLYE